MRKVCKFVTVFLIVVMLVTTFAFAAPSSYSIAFHALCQQPYNQLCWAGVCAGVINTYNNESMSVTDVARLGHPIGNLNKGLILFDLDASGDMSIQKVLEAKGIEGSSVQTLEMPPTSDELTECIYENGSPVVVSLKNVESTASHAVLINGYAENVNTFEYFVSVSDPWFARDPDGYTAQSSVCLLSQLVNDDPDYGGIETVGEDMRYCWEMSLFNFNVTD